MIFKFARARNSKKWWFGSALFAISLFFIMKEHPILFSAPMVRAILDGRKTQTRRVVKFPSDFDDKEVFDNGCFGLKYTSSQFEGCVERLRPKWKIGDRLWVKETFGIHPDYNPPYNFEGQYVYRATDPDWETTEGWKWKPSIFMPRFGSRITLEVVDVRAERLCDISPNDAISEGIKLHYPVPGDGDPWFSNPHVWVITFIRL